MEQKNKSVKIKTKSLTLVLAFVAVALLAFNTVQLMNIDSIPTVTGAATTQTTRTTAAPAPAAAASGPSDAVIEEALAAIMPTGVPEIYGEELSITFDDTVGGLNVLAGLERSITFDSLSESQQERFVAIATSPETACEYCCGIGKKGFGTEEGKVACGCSHNLAFSGLTKYLLQNHEDEVTDEFIKEEIQKWKNLFFPKQTVQKYLEETGQVSAAASLPGMVGGC